MKKNLKYIGYFLLLLPVIISLLGVFVVKNNYRPAIILSGSMEPALSVDDLVFTKKTDEIKVGDVVAFYDDDGKKVMHRVIEVNDEVITTKGDANNVLDKPIKRQQVVGVYAGKIKYVGKIFRFIKSPLGLVVLLLFCTMIFLFPYIKKKIKKDTFGKEVRTKKDKVKIVFAGVLYTLFLIGCVMAGYYSRYQYDLAGNDKVVVASWNNNIELLSGDTLIFQNEKNDTNLIKFNLIYESDVSAYYSISLDNVSQKLGLELSNDEFTLSIKKVNNDFIVNFNNNIGTFDISRLQTDYLVTLNNIQATYELNGTNDVYLFKDKQSDRMVKVTTKGNNFNLQFTNFGKFQVNDERVKAFNLKISAITAELPNLDNLELYATFEQID